MEDKGIMAVGDEMGEGMQCSNHPYGNNLGGICALCLQEKLGKLVSSTNDPAPFLSIPPPPSSATQKEKNTGGGVRKVTSSLATASDVVVLNRSKSVAPRPIGAISDDSPRKKSFWSFLYLSSATSTAATLSSTSKRRSTSSGNRSDRDLKQEAADSKEDQEAVVDSPGGSQASSSSFGRNVSRSRSLGCGSRSFSADFLERISTGFGDCTLGRVESHREPNNAKDSNKMMLRHHDSDEQMIKLERVKCGRIFGGFGMVSSSSSTYWLSASAAAGDGDFHTKTKSTARASTAIVGGSEGRRRRSTWGWAFPSPMRALRPTTSSSSPASKSYVATTNAITSISNSKVGANPSMLAVGG